ncbi:MAG: hypothetical protein QXD24_07300 [Candidatus Caldarchaeum sp.]
METGKNVDAASLHRYIRPRGLLSGGVRRRVVITSPPYGRLQQGYSPRYGRLVVSDPGNLTVMTGKHFRAAWLGTLTSTYLSLNRFARNRDLVIIVLKNFRNNGLHKTGKDLLETTKELASFIGFKVIDVLKFRIEGNHFARYHTVKGHSHDLYHEYVLVMKKVV